MISSGKASWGSMTEWQWEDPKDFWFTGCVYLTEEEEEHNLTHFWIGLDKTRCGIKADRIKPSNHAVVTCPECSKTIFYTTEESLLRRLDEFLI
ncbi:MAG: hypothetical protein KME12_23555 [Trichocoleus desertorum ATA4-8-CV12]|jgi:DNA-directed RNA polymerase subunit RPC12/RpoP|nr:hypothetical protein [Trichocoleus desertorum ATA4-8-CV12]